MTTLAPSFLILAGNKKRTCIKALMSPNFNHMILNQKFQASNHLVCLYSPVGVVPGCKLFLAHLSRRLIGELIVYGGIRRPSSVRLSTFSKDISSEAMRPILFIFHI